MLRIGTYSIIGLLLGSLLTACSPAQDNTTPAADGTNKEVDTMSANEQAGQEFLAKNATAEGVIVTATGLQYKVINSGSGATPGPTDTVRTHYHGTFIDGRVFDSSVDRGAPLEFPVNGVISGWTEALQLMQEGDKWQLFVPPELAYGQRGVGPIPGNTTLVFEVELIKVL
jgi:FKBP-type peptidyl-prolyl cis-trans isomerase FklB